MLKLKKLQILGFKSFCDRTELKFHGDGVAAIIGPNGCGKSNISDAIAWVLGEQSAKTLRGARMEDVIFAGTRDRKPTGMAEVALTLIDPEVYDGPDAGNPTEIEIQDELPREAESDFANWNEDELRAKAAEETERLTEEAQPGVTEGDADASMEAEPSAAVPQVGPQVVLKIRRRKFEQRFKAGEIVVTRRLFRSGDSEYLLNGKLCRLRDIQELFMGTGLGPESYALIEQGRIGQILSSRPTDRRAIIEEAAGITKFKTKKRLAEARLEDAKLNLARINDIFDEVSRQMNSLKRQAAKAERYGRLRDEMKAKLRIVLASKFAHLATEVDAIAGQLTSVDEHIRVQTESCQQLEQDHSAGAQRGYELENEIRSNREQISENKLATDRALAQRRHNEERCEELNLRAASAEAELAQAQVKLLSLSADRDSNRQILESALSDVTLAKQELSSAQQDAVSASEGLAALEQEQEQTRISILEAVASISRLRNQTTQSEERIAAMDRESNKLHLEVGTAQSQAETFGGQRGQIAIEFETVSQRLSGLTDDISNARASLESKRREETEAKHHLDSLRAEYATALGKKGSLEAVIAEHGYSTESVRRLFQSGVMNGGHAPVGVLADFLEVENRYEGVVEDFLRDELNFIVVKSWDAADEGLRLLRSDVDGRATFLVHPEDSQAKFSFLVDESLHHAPSTRPVVPLKSTIRVLDGFGKSLEVILPKLRDGYIVPDSAIGRELALENPDAFFLAPSGECFHNVTVTGGKQRSEGPLSMKRELREAAKLMNDLEAALRHEETRVMTLGREIKDITSLLERLEGEKREAEKQAMTSGHLLNQLDSEMTRVRERAEVCRRELSRLDTDRSEQTSRVAALRSEIANLDQQRQLIEAKAASAIEELARLRQQRDQSSQIASDRRANLATLEERHRAATGVLQRIESLVVDLEQRVQALSNHISAAAAEKQHRETENTELSSRLVQLEAYQTSSQERESVLQGESNQLRAKLAEIEESLRASRSLLDQARDRRGGLHASAAKLQSDGEYMAQTCMNELGVERDHLMADNELVLLAGEELATEDQAYRDMRSRLDAMGPVNMMALEEFKESAERHGFLDGQRKDLLEAIENTQATIKEIDTFSRQKFEEAFHKINENFGVTFRKLFGGGHGFMRLTDEENSAESGIDVVASPPGKKLQNVLLLSGGEKALTALALLVGIFQYAPSPFCILDEVDAPLDEANIGRFTELVKEMSVQTQFVLITHSKRTMSIAPVLYGVTMQEPGVSKLVSVRFGAA